MLWYKGWLETQARLVMSLAFMGFLLFFWSSLRSVTPVPGIRSPFFGVVVFSNPSFMVTICTLLAGAGIATQAAFQATKGLHGSTLFTLSLPVSRFRLFATRAALGWLEMTGGIVAFCGGMWIVSPLLRSSATGVEVLEYVGTMLACASSVYFLSVLMATFLDDQWRMWGTILGSSAIWWLTSYAPREAPISIFQAMGEGSPLIAHAVPWAAIAFSAGVAAILFFAALKIVQIREY